MRLSATFGRACAALVLLAMCGAEPVTTAPAEASTPSLLWANARHLAVNCLIQSSTAPDARSFADGFCARVSALVARGAPFPVKAVEAGDPALIAADTVTLLVHASVERTPRGRTLAFTIRPARRSDADSEVLYGTAPRAVELPDGNPQRALDSALGEALQDLLPWQRPSGLVARPL